MIELAFLTLLGLYLVVGFVFAVRFLLPGSNGSHTAVRLDPALKDSSRLVRLLLVPGAVAVWPLVLSRIYSQRSFQ